MKQSIDYEYGNFIDALSRIYFSCLCFCIFMGLVFLLYVITGIDSLLMFMLTFVLGILFILVHKEKTRILTGMRRDTTDRMVYYFTKYTGVR